MSEASIVKQIQLAATKFGARLFRNNTAKTWIGQSVRYDRAMNVKVGPGDVVIRHARRLHAGLCVGSSDLIGWTPKNITEDMIGQSLAVFTASEVKTEIGKATAEQLRFIDFVNSHGGYAGICRNADDFYKMVGGQSGI